MFCGKCGAKNDDNATFCGVCGAAFNVSQADNGAPAFNMSGAAAVNNSSNNRNKKVGIIAVAIVAVIAIIIAAFSMFGGRSYKEAINQFVDAQFSADAKAIVNLMPKKLINASLKEEGIDEDEFNDSIKEMDEMLEGMLDSLKHYYGDDYRISHKIVGAEAYSKDDFEDLQEEYLEYADIKVSDAKLVAVELTIKSDEYDFEDSDTTEISVIKIGRSWYIDFVNTDLF